MRKILTELVISIAVLLGVWLLLSQLNWMSILKIEQTTKTTEEKIGELFLKVLKNQDSEITSDSVVSTVDSMLYRICSSNSIDQNEIKVHVLRTEEINAFALPDKHLVIHTGLISACENEAELYGVMAHELAHLEKNHVMNKLVKEIGLSVLISLSTGNGNPEMMKEALRQLSSTAYDRSLETEADLTAVDYLITSGIDPEGFANFLYRLSDESNKIPYQVYWISTHPDSKKRAESIIEHALKSTVDKAFSSDSIRFKQLKNKLEQIQ